jgi:hypothetical protein
VKKAISLTSTTKDNTLGSYGLAAQIMRQSLERARTGTECTPLYMSTGSADLTTNLPIRWVALIRNKWGAHA